MTQSHWSGSKAPCEPNQNELGLLETLIRAPALAARNRAPTTKANREPKMTSASVLAGISQANIAAGKTSTVTHTLEATLRGATLQAMACNSSNSVRSSKKMP